MNVRANLLALVLVCMGNGLSVVEAQDEPGQAGGMENVPKLVADGMDNARLQALIAKVDPEMVGTPGNWRFRVKELTVSVITDEKADRMRIIIPVRNLDGMSGQDLLRLLQANFDSALDARYAVAKGVLWATYIHPLSALTDREFLLGLGQTVNIVRTYGRSYSSGLLLFGGGDSAEIQQKELLEELIEKGGII